MLPRYTSQIVNLANTYSQATRAKHVGQMSELLQEYRQSTSVPTVAGFKVFHRKRCGIVAPEATRKIYEMLNRMRDALQDVTPEMVAEWVNDLLFAKTFQGLTIQDKILKQTSETYRLATPDEESRGIDGWSDGEPVSIKPISYRKTLAEAREKIRYRIIYYRVKSDGSYVIVE